MTSPAACSPERRMTVSNRPKCFLTRYSPIKSTKLLVRTIGIASKSALVIFDGRIGRANRTSPFWLIEEMKGSARLRIKPATMRAVGSITPTVCAPSLSPVLDMLVRANWFSTTGDRSHGKHRTRSHMSDAFRHLANPWRTRRQPCQIQRGWSLCPSPSQSTSTGLVG